MATLGPREFQRSVWSRSVLQALADDCDQDLEKLFSRKSACAWFEQRVERAGSSYSFGDAAMAGISLRHELGDTALHVAARNGKEMSTLCLIANGLRVDSVNCAGKTPPEVSSSDDLRARFQVGSPAHNTSPAPTLFPEVVPGGVPSRSCDTSSSTRMFGEVERISQVLSELYLNA